MDERKACLGRGIVIALDVAYVACGGKAVALCKKLYVLVLLEKVVAITFDVFDKVLRMTIGDLIVSEE